MHCRKQENHHRSLAARFCVQRNSGVRFQFWSHGCCLFSNFQGPGLNNIEYSKMLDDGEVREEFDLCWHKKYDHGGCVKKYGDESGEDGLIILYITLESNKWFISKTVENALATLTAFRPL